MFPLIVSTFDIAGGAARAAARLGLTLNQTGMETAMLAGDKASDYHWVMGRKSYARSFGTIARNYIGAALLKSQKDPLGGTRSMNRLPSRLDQQINALPHDVVNLHWVGGEMMSIEAMGRIAKPVVWTMHDMWPFLGAEHYAPDDQQARWREGYSTQSRAKGASGLDLDRATWRRKQAAWCRPWHLISPSRWLAKCAAQSTLMRDWPVHVIANPLDLAVLRPWPKNLAREMLGLPADKVLIGFGAMGGTSDPRKGWDLLHTALKMVAEAQTGAEAVLFGQSRPPHGGDVPLPSHWTGHLSDEITLALLYSAVDMVVVPSRQDNLPQTATEAQACGCPVVAFDIGGLPDTMEDGKTGFLAPAFDETALARHLILLARDSDLRAAQGTAARDRAERLWAPAVVAEAYKKVYQAAIDGR